MKVISSAPGVIKQIRKITSSGLKEKFIHLPNGIRLEYAEQGNADGIPVILVHGYPDSWHSFKTVLSNLSSNIHAIAITLRGHGGSTKPLANYDPAVFATDIAEFVKLKKLKNVFITGHSWGGLVAQQFALDYPELIKGLILISTDASFTDNPVMQEFAEEVSGLHDTVPYKFVEEFQKSVLENPIDHLFLNTLIAESLKVPSRVWKSAARGFMAVNYTDRLNELNIPVLITWGEKDSICPKKGQEILMKKIKNAKLIIYEGTGHALHWEQPERFAAELVAFVQGSS